MEEKTISVTHFKAESPEAKQLFYTFCEIVTLGLKMREAQTEYFKARQGRVSTEHKKDLLLKAINLEKEFDLKLTEWKIEDVKRKEG